MRPTLQLMDAGTRQHIYITLYLVGLGGLTSLPVAILCYALVCGIFIGREHAQAEERWIDRYAKDRLRANMPWDAGFRMVVWDRHSLLGVAMPVVFGGLFLGTLYGSKELVKITLGGL